MLKLPYNLLFSHLTSKLTKLMIIKSVEQPVYPTNFIQQKISSLAIDKIITNNSITKTNLSVYYKFIVDNILLEINNN